MTRTTDIKAGDRFTFLTPAHDEANYYVATSDYHDGNVERYHIYNGERQGPTRLDYFGDDECRILNRNIKEKTDVYDTYRDAKLDLAADFGLQARFTYTNERGETARRTLTVEDYDGEYVGGVTPDGYRRFRLDRIEGKVVIR